MAEKKSTGETSEGSKNFLKQFRDIKTRDFKRITAGQFMDVWNHYDSDGKYDFFFFKYILFHIHIYNWYYDTYFNKLATGNRKKKWARSRI